MPKAVTKEEIIAAIQECTKTLGHTPTNRELRTHYNVAPRDVQRAFGGHKNAVAACGLEPRGSGHEVSMENLFRDWAEIARRIGRIPSRTTYQLMSRYSVRPLTHRFKSWGEVPRGLRRYAEEEGLDAEYADVLEMIRNFVEGKKEVAATWPSRRILATSAATLDTSLGTLDTPTGSPGTSAGIFGTSVRMMAGTLKATLLPDRPVYGPPMIPAALACGPSNELGVIYLFGMLAGQLGYMVTRIQAEFPDCEAIRMVDENIWQGVRIEFEYESRNFARHLHKPSECDVIVCWIHNWPECPLEVVELKTVVRAMQHPPRRHGATEENQH